MKAISINKLSLGSLAILVVAAVSINIISSRVYTRADLTSDSIYTLSEGTERILGKLDSEVVAKLYFSRSIKNLPPMIKTYATRVEEVLGEYASMSGGVLKLEVYDPKPDTDEEETARGFGIRSAQLPTGDEMFFGIVFVKGKEEATIPYLDPRREEFLEFDLSEALVKLKSDDKPKVGILSSLQVIAPQMPPQMMQGAAPEGWALAEQLKGSFDVQPVNPNTDKIPDDIRVLFVIHPKQFSDKMLFAIDQFVMRGGRLAVAVDPFSRTDFMQSAAQMGMQQRMQKKSNSDLPKLFEAWGIEFESGKLVGDLSGMVQVNAGGMPTPYPFFYRVDPEKIASSSAVTQKLKSLMIAEGGSFSKKKDSAHEWEHLVTTTKDSGTADSMMISFMGPAEMAKQLQVDDQEHVVAALVTGEFASAFQAGAPEGVDGGNLLQKSSKNSILLFADVDFMYDDNAVEKFRFGPQVIMRPRNDNLNLVLNGIEYLGGNDDLISIRTSGRIARPFTKVQELQKVAQQKWQEEEEQLSNRLTELQKKLRDLEGQKSQGARFGMSQAQQEEIKQFRQEEVEIRKRRREVRKNLREDIEALGNRLIALNMLLMPFCVGAFGVFVFARRNRRMKGER